MRYNYGYGTNRRRQRRQIKYALLSMAMLIAGFSMSLFRTPKQEAATVTADATGTKASTNRELPASLPPVAPKAASRPAVRPPHSASGCSESRRANLEGSANAQLHKLAEYEAVCAGAIERASFFVPLPTTSEEAQSYADDAVATLQAFARADVSPVVFLEPTNAAGGVVDVVQYGNGAYDGALNAYFAALRNKGITDGQMGMWVILPEWNLPEWGSVDPGLFANLVTRTVKLQKQRFPTSKASILLDSKTYPTADSWEGANYVSLLPYVQGIPRGLLDSFGLQGFPWSPPATDRGEALTDPRTYLRVDLAAAAAKVLGVKDIWLNTGTFGTAYAADSARRVTVTPEKRKQQLTGVLAQATWLQTYGFGVTIHVFAENKAAAGESIDWSYWPAGQTTTSQATAVFKTFAEDSRTAAIKLWLYDADE